MLRPAATIALAAWTLACSAPAREVAGSASDGLVFSRRVGSKDDLYRARLSDGAVRPFLATRDRSETWPYWSEACRRLLFQTELLEGGSAELFVWQPGQAQAQPLAQRPGRNARWAEWSPDGSRVVFAFRKRNGATGIAAVDVASGREELLAASGVRDPLYRPSYAPDGRRVVAQRPAPDGEGSTLWLIEPGEPPRRLTPEAGWFEQKPFFTRDGAWVVFARARGQAPRELALVDAQGRIVPLEAGRAGADEHSARPSPTRDEIAFVSDRDGSRDIFLAPLSGGPARNLTRTRDRDEFAPRWSPDGERLVVTRVPPQAPGRAGDKLDPAQTQLVVIDRSGRVLFETQGMMADWMPPF